MNIRIGTRKSKLAMIQTGLVEAAIRRAAPDAQIGLVPITTKGDRILDRPLSQIGGRGVFITEIERALLDGEIDLAVHSGKDLPVQIAEGTCIGAVLPRADARDVLVTRLGEPLPAAPIIGTGSRRRALAIQKRIPDAEIRDLRGNVDTRLQKLADGQYDAVILAAAGLERLGCMQDTRFDFQMLPMQQHVPAACQGIIAVQSREGELTDVLQAVSDPDTLSCFETERHVLRLLDAGCSAPVGAYASIAGERIRLLVTKDGTNILSGEDAISERFALAERLVKSL